MEFVCVQVYSKTCMKTLSRQLHSTSLNDRKVTVSAAQRFDRIQEGPLTSAVKRVERVLELLVTAERLRSQIYTRAFSGDSPKDELASKYDFSEEKRLYPGGVVGDCQFSDPITRELNETYRRSLTELARCLKRYRSKRDQSSGIQAMTGFNGCTSTRVNIPMISGTTPRSIGCSNSLMDLCTTQCAERPESISPLRCLLSMDLCSHRSSAVLRRTMSKTLRGPKS